MAATDPHKLLRKRAAAAALTLLGVPPAARAASPAKASAGADHWTFDASFLSYSESERISVLEPQFGVRREYSDDRALTILATVDSITGATPLGTLPATGNTAPNTVTSASGRGGNPIIGKMPLSNMTDTRYALDTSWSQPLGTAYTGLVGANVSKETDYLTAGGNAKISRDFNDKNTTLSLGVAPEFDISSPNGGLPTAFADASAPESIAGKRDEKWFMSGQAGITQILDRRTVMQFNYGLTHERGYLNDPYKLLSIINAQGDPLSAIFEKRPGKRTEQNLYWMVKRNVWSNDVVSFGLRYYTDDWGIRSHTLEFTFHRQSSDHFYWEPNVRYYHQSAADFYRLGLLNTQALPQFASADLRMAEFAAVTFGVSFGYTLDNGSLVIVRADYYTQNGDSRPQEAVGAQRAYDLFPTLNATILQIEYQFDPGTLWRPKSRR